MCAMAFAELPWRGAPGPLPLPPRGTVAGPTMPAQLFPTNNLRWGDVVNVTGPFQGLMQGMVRVKFTGGPWLAPFLTGPFSGSVQVPEGAETGECLIEINGRRAFGTQCVITPATGYYGQKVAPQRSPYGEEWKNVGEKGTALGGANRPALGGIIDSPIVMDALIGLLAAELDYRLVRKGKGQRLDERFILVAIGAALLKGAL